MKVAGTAVLVAMLLASSTAGVRAETPAPPLRHLTFDLALEVSYSSQQGGLRDIAAPTGGGTVETQRGETHQIVIVCDIVASNPDGDLLIDVSEAGLERSVPPSRIVLHLDGTFGYMPNQKPLAEEESALLPFLARGYIGPAPHPVNDTWEVGSSADKFKAKTTFRVTAVKAQTEDIAFDEEYSFSGAEGYTGAGHGAVSYDPGKLVPEHIELFLTTRMTQMGQATTVRYRANYSLKEDSFSKHA
jgi:hypothetical protein